MVYEIITTRKHANQLSIVQANWSGIQLEPTTSHSLPLTPHPSLLHLLTPHPLIFLPPPLISSPVTLYSPHPHLLISSPLTPSSPYSLISLPLTTYLLTPHPLISLHPHLLTHHPLISLRLAPHLSLYDLLTPLSLISSPFTPFLPLTLHLLTSHSSPHHLLTPLSPHPSLPYLLTFLIRQ